MSNNNNGSSKPTLTRTKIQQVHISIAIFICLCSSNLTSGQTSSGYDLWLGYSKISDDRLLKEYQQVINSIYFYQNSDISKAARQELSAGLSKMFGQTSNFSNTISPSNTLIIATKEYLDKDISTALEDQFDVIGSEGFIIKTVPREGKRILLLTANEDIGIMYGVFKLLRLMQTHQKISGLQLVEIPKTQLRMLNHWDNLDRTIERTPMSCTVTFFDIYY